MAATTRPRIWALIEPLNDPTEAGSAAALPAVVGEAVARCGCRLQALMDDDQAVRALARPKAPDLCVVSGSVDLFEVTAGPGDDSEGRLRSVCAVVTLADGFEFSAYLMPDQAQRVAKSLKMK